MFFLLSVKKVKLQILFVRSWFGSFGMATDLDKRKREQTKNQHFQGDDAAPFRLNEQLNKKMKNFQLN